MTDAMTPSIALDQLLSGYVDAPVPALTVTGLCLDSREIQTGDVYFALQGSQTHGIEYAQAAVKKGAVAVLVDADDKVCEALSEDLAVPLLTVPQLNQNVGLLASRYFSHPSQKMSVCGVTGTDGKTSVCRFVAQALHQLGFQVGYIGTIGWGLNTSLAANPLTTPDAISLQRMINDLHQQGAEYIVLEASSHALVQGRVAGIAFDVAVLTNLGRDHLDYHGDLAAYKAAKARLFESTGLSAIVVNNDDAFGRELAARYSESVPVSAFSTAGAAEAADTLQAGQKGNSGATLLAKDIQVNENGISFTLDDGQSSYAITSALLGRFNVENLLSCFAVLRAFGTAAHTAAKLLSNLSAVPGRMERFGDVSNTEQTSVVVDFAHTPQALQAALQTLRTHCRGRLWVVFGCGGDRDPGKRPLMGEVAAAEADVLVVTDDNPRTEASAAIIDSILQGIPNGTEHLVIADRRQAIAHAVHNAAVADWVLVAGKGHEDYQIVGTEYLAFSDRDIVRALLQTTVAGAEVQS